MSTVGIFDSGLGGLSTLRALMRAGVDADVVYLADTARAPYGVNSGSVIAGYVRECCKKLLSAGCQSILIACGTATSNAEPEFLSSLGVPVSGTVEPTCRQAAAASRNGKIALLATQASIDSGAFQQRLRQLRPECEILPLACADFVPVIESGELSGPRVNAAAKKYLSSAGAFGADTVILGCTHFPLVSAAIAPYFPGATLVDSGAALAALAAAECPRGNLCARFLVSGDAAAFSASARLILGVDVDAAHFDWS